MAAIYTKIECFLLSLPQYKQHCYHRITLTLPHHRFKHSISFDNLLACVRSAPSSRARGIRILNIVCFPQHSAATGIASAFRNTAETPRSFSLPARSMRTVVDLQQKRDIATRNNRSGLLVYYWDNIVSNLC